MKKGLLVASVAIASAFTACTPSTPSVQSVDLATGQDTVSYALGLYTGSQMTVVDQVIDGTDMGVLASAFNNAKPSEKALETYRQSFGEINQDVFMVGLTNQILGDTTIFTMQKANMFLQGYAQRLTAEKGQKNLDEGTKFLEENKAKEGVVTLPSGLQYKVIEAGKGAKPAKTDRVKVDYTGKLLNGTVFDSSVERGEPVVFGVTQVIPGWTEALQLMPVGSKWELYIPSDLAYGSKGAGGSIEPNSTLIFEVELLSIEK